MLLTSCVDVVVRRCRDLRTLRKKIQKGIHRSTVLLDQGKTEGSKPRVVSAGVSSSNADDSC